MSAADIILFIILFVCGFGFGYYVRPFWRAFRFWRWRNTPYIPMGAEPPPGYDEWYYPDGHRRR